MSEAHLDALIARLTLGDSLEAVLEQLRPAGEQELLKRCATVHSFDEELFEVLRCAAPEVRDSGLPALLSSGAVEPVPGRDGHFRVPVAQRIERYGRWWAEDPGALVPLALLELTKGVLAHYERTGDDDVESLYHELLLTPDAGLMHFKVLFDRSARAYDVARCHDLVDVVTERLPVLGPRAAPVPNEYRQRLQALAMWTRDWYRTARFLVPAHSEAALEGLLRGERGRVLVLWSGGGMGKTSHLRWLITRRCIPDGDACARVDFDDVDALVAAQEPALVLLEAASQLDRQLPEAPFHELLSQHAAQLDRLRGRPGAPFAASPAVAADISERFGAAVRDVAGDRRVLIVLDTLEEALMLRAAGREKTDLSALLRMLADVLEAAPAVRLVLASRYPLSERVLDFAALMPEAIELLIKPFSDEEAGEYVTRYRGIEAPDMVASLVRGARGVPFTLELLCDTAEQRPDLSPDEVADCAHADLDWVMNRIVGRLDPGLQRVLRYGVAPRTLERVFVSEVLAPLLGDDVTERWLSLKRYAGSASWVMLDPVDADAVRFHVAVLDPMRKLLGKESIHDELQERASAWFEGRARTDPARATRWLCEAVYHRFQYQGPEAERYWRRLLDDARRGERPDRRRALAAEVLRDDYVDGGGARAWRDGDEILRAETLLRARWELAIAAVQLAQEDTPERREAGWLEAERAVDDLEHLRKGVTRAPVTDAELALVKAGIRLGRGDFGGAEDLVRRALRGHLLPEDRLWLWIVYAESASRFGEDSAEHFRRALKFADKGRDPAADRAAVLLRVARHHAERDRLDKAGTACDEGLKIADGRTRQEMTLVRAHLDVRLGAPSDALKRLGLAPDDEAQQEAEVGARRNIVAIRALIGGARPLEALELAEATGARYSAALQLGSSREQAVAAEGRELRGKVRAALLDVEGATKDLEEAANRWSRLGSPEGVCRCWVRSAAFQLHGMRDLNRAEGLLDQGRRTRAVRGEDAWTRCTLVGAELLARRGRQARAEELVDEVIGALKAARRPPRAFVEAAMRGLTIAREPSRERYAALLCEHLERVTPATARLTLLEPLEDCPPLVGSMPARLRKLVPSPIGSARSYARVPERDLAVLALVDAQVERILGRAAEARRALDRASSLLMQGGSQAAVQRLLRAAVRCGHTVLMTALVGRELERLEAAGGGVVLDASVLLQVADRLAPAPLRTRAIAVAARIIDDHGAAAGGWLPCMLELQARDASRHGDDALARTRWQQAAVGYRALGEDARSREILERHAPEARAPAVLLAEDEARLSVRLHAGEMTFSVRRRGGEETVHRRSDAPPLIRALVEAAPGIVQHAASPVVVRRLTEDAWGVGEELGDLLVAMLRDRGGGERLDVGLRAKETAVRALPWELATPVLRAAGLNLFRRAPRARGQAPDARGVQGALNRVLDVGLGLDGLLGPRDGGGPQHVPGRRGADRDRRGRHGNSPALARRGLRRARTLGRDRAPVAAR